MEVPRALPVGLHEEVLKGVISGKSRFLHFTAHIFTHLAAARAERLETTPKRRR